jgi:hypothetical protein
VVKDERQGIEKVGRNVSHPALKGSDWHRASADPKARNPHLGGKCLSGCCSLRQLAVAIRWFGVSLTFVDVVKHDTTLWSSTEQVQRGILDDAIVGQ